MTGVNNVRQWTFAGFGLVRDELGSVRRTAGEAVVTFHVLRLGRTVAGLCGGTMGFVSSGQL